MLRRIMADLFPIFLFSFAAGLLYGMGAGAQMVASTVGIGVVAAFAWSADDLLALVANKWPGSRLGLWHWRRERRRDQKERLARGEFARALSERTGRRARIAGR